MSAFGCWELHPMRFVLLVANAIVNINLLYNHSLLMIQ
nr:MAG TPA: hypothetical protein [Caudoviricetes sp.]